MRKGILLIFLCLLKFVYAQPVNNCTAYELCQAVIGTNYNETEKAILLRNWNDFAGEDLDSAFPIEKNGRHHTFNIRFDGLGCIFPSYINDSRFQQLYLHEGKDQRDYTKLSFFDAYLCDTINKHFRNSIPQELAILFQQQLAGKQESLNKKESGAAQIYAFRKNWNNYFLKQTQQALQETIERNSIKHVFFFIHGFNVPYALAHLQSNRLFKTVVADLPPGVKQEDILFVRVFWPALSEKRSNFTGANCDIGNNRLAVYKTKLYNYATNRAYLAGVTLNEIISYLPKDLPVQVMTHSFGSVVASSIIFNPLLKIKWKDQQTPLNRELLKEYEAAKDLSDRRLNFFMNAAGMPGVSTFSSIDIQKNRNHYFFIGHNKSDKTLLKAFLPIVRFARSKNASTLGCNHWGEVKKVEQLFNRALLPGHFQSARTSTDKEHDFFCYAQQNGFKQLFKRFIAYSIN